MAKLSTPPIPLKMYRHFAVITLTVTALIAVFADGENQQAIAAQIEAGNRQDELQQKNAEKFGRKELLGTEDVQDHTYSPHPDDGGFDGRFGAPMDETGGRSSGSSIAYASQSNGNQAVVPASYSPLGLTQQEWAALSEAKRRELLAKVRQPSGPPGNSEQREQAIRRLQQASEARASR